MSKRINYQDFKRLSRKAALAVADKYDISEASAGAAESVVIGYFHQARDDMKRGGSAKARKEGIWSATVSLLNQYPDATAKQIWAKIPDVELEDIRWGFELDGDKLVQVDGTTGKIQSITFETFRTGYFTQVRKMLNRNVE